MYKKVGVVLAVLIICILMASVSTIGATDEGPTTCTPPQGCSPGFYKQEHHFQYWFTYEPADFYDEVFEAGPHITLIDALELKGGGENRFLAHSTAAILNAANPDICYGGWYGNEDMVQWFVQETYDNGEGDFVMKKDILEELNKAGCPLE